MLSSTNHMNKTIIFVWRYKNTIHSHSLSRFSSEMNWRKSIIPSVVGIMSEERTKNMPPLDHLSCVFIVYCVVPTQSEMRIDRYKYSVCMYLLFIWTVAVIPSRTRIPLHEKSLYCCHAWRELNHIMLYNNNMSYSNKIGSSLRFEFVYKITISVHFIFGVINFTAHTHPCQPTFWIKVKKDTIGETRM